MSLSKEEATAILKKSQADPAWWMREVLGSEPWSKQIETIEAVRDNRVVAVKGCHGGGKSWDAARTAMWFLYNHRPSIVITTAGRPATS